MVFLFNAPRPVTQEKTGSLVKALISKSFSLCFEWRRGQFVQQRLVSMGSLKLMRALNRPGGTGPKFPSLKLNLSQTHTEQKPPGMFSACHGFGCVYDMHCISGDGP